MRGFSLIELLISVLIFTLVVLAIYFFFDQGQWLYLSSQKRAHIQENARLAVEQMERDFRMIGAGVPSGGHISDGRVWTPPIFDATIARIALTADVDDGSRLLTEDVGIDGNDRVFVGDPPNYYDSFLPQVSLPIVLASNESAWVDLIATNLASADRAIVTSTAVPTPATFQSGRSSVHTLERIFYRMVNQGGAVVDSGVCADPYPFCTVQRQEFMTNNPDETNPEAETANASWITIATNATIFELKYYTASDFANPIPDPSGGPLSGVNRIAIFLRCRDREMSRPGEFQNADLKTNVLIRNN